MNEVRSGHITGTPKFPARTRAPNHSLAAQIALS